MQHKRKSPRYCLFYPSYQMPTYLKCWSRNLDPNVEGWGHLKSGNLYGPEINSPLNALSTVVMYVDDRAQFVPKLNKSLSNRYTLC